MRAYYETFKDTEDEEPEEERKPVRCPRCGRYLMRMLDEHQTTDICKRGHEQRKLVMKGWLPGAAGPGQGVARGLLFRKLHIAHKSSTKHLEKVAGYRTWYPTHAVIAMINSGLTTSIPPTSEEVEWGEQFEQLKRDIAQCKAEPGYVLVLAAEIKATRRNGLYICDNNMTDQFADWLGRMDKKYGHLYVRARDN